MPNRLKFVAVVLLLIVSAVTSIAQDQLPEPGAPRSFAVPAIAEKRLPNGLTVAVVERKNVPLVTVRLMIKRGARTEDPRKAGLAGMTAVLATKRTTTRTADQIAEQMEFLGGSLSSGADWGSSTFTFTVSTDKLDAAMAILGDVVLNATSDAKELELLRAQALDNLAADLQQPSFLAAYVSTRYSFGEHPIGGTPESLKTITRADILAYRKMNHRPENSVLIFTGDITATRANAIAAKTFATWRRDNRLKSLTFVADPKTETSGSGRILVIDLPNSGQSAVSYTQKLLRNGRMDCSGNGCVSSKLFFPAIVTNSVLGGGYSSRLNQEIRIKRGLSYGAGSSFAWRPLTANFATRTQTKDDSAAEVAEIVVSELKRLGQSDASESELAPRKLVITGDFSREFETTAELSEAVAAIYSYGLPASALKTFQQDVNAVTIGEVREFAARFLQGGDLVIAGDYSKFKEDLAKRFPGAPLFVISAANIDLSKESLQK